MSAPVAWTANAPEHDLVRPILDPHPEPGSNAKPATGSHAVVLNLALAILGPGVLSIPYALSVGGYALVSLMLALTALMNTYTIMALVEGAALVSPESRSFSGIATVAYGRWAGVFVDSNVAVYLFGCVCGNLIAISTLGARFFQWVHWEISDHMVLAGSVVGVLPVCLVRDLSFLGRVVSPFGVAALSGVVASVLVLYCVGDDREAIDAVRLSEDMLLAFPIATFSFSAQPYVFELFFEREVSDPEFPDNIKSFAYHRSVVCAAMLFSFVIYMGIGVFGVLQFGTDTKSDILLNYNTDSAAPCLMAGGMAVAVLICLPINVFPLRSLLDKLLPQGQGAGLRFTAITVGILGVSAVVALSVSNLGRVFDLTGATGCMFCCYLLPCMILGKLEGRWRAGSIATVLIGVPCSLVSLYKIVPELY